MLPTKSRKRNHDTWFVPNHVIVEPTPISLYFHFIPMVNRHQHGGVSNVDKTTFPLQLPSSSSIKPIRKEEYLHKIDTHVPDTVHTTYVATKFLGQGSFGKAYLGYPKQTPSKQVVIKILSEKTVWSDIDMYLHETSILHHLQEMEPKTMCSQFLTQVLDVGKDKDYHVMMVMEYFPGKNLDELLDEKYKQRRRDLCSKDIKLRIMLHLQYGLYCLHSQGIIHNDIKNENVLIQLSTGNIQYIDFGLANHHHEYHYSWGTYVWMDPYRVLKHTEAFEKKKSKEEVFHLYCAYDYFSLGLLIYSLIVESTDFISKIGAIHRPENTMTKKQKLTALHAIYTTMLQDPDLDKFYQSVPSSTMEYLVTPMDLFMDNYQQRYETMQQKVKIQMEKDVGLFSTKPSSSTTSKTTAKTRKHKHGWSMKTSSSMSRSLPRKKQNKHGFTIDEDVL